MKSVRSRIGIGLGMCAMVSLLGGNVASAQDAESTWKAMGFKISGAVEASYTQNFNNPNTNVNSLRIFDTQANSFVPQVAQIVFEKEARRQAVLWIGSAFAQGSILAPNPGFHGLARISSPAQTTTRWIFKNSMQSTSPRSATA